MVVEYKPGKRTVYKYDTDTGKVFGHLGREIKAKTADGYLAVEPCGKQLQLHRFIYEMMGVTIPEGMHVDHINHNKLDNRWSNLRIASATDNNKNLPKRKDNTSGVTGIYFRDNRWQAAIKVNKKQLHLGSFKTKDEAVAARLEAERLYGYHINHGK